MKGGGGGGGECVEIECNIFGEFFLGGSNVEK